VQAVVAGALTSPGLDDLATDYAELGLDALIDSDTVSEIPVVKSLVSVVRMGKGVRDRSRTDAAPRRSAGVLRRAEALLFPAPGCLANGTDTSPPF
jgi:hypothetical protein